MLLLLLTAGRITGVPPQEAVWSVADVPPPTSASVKCPVRWLNATGSALNLVKLTDVLGCVVGGVFVVIFETPSA